MSRTRIQRQPARHSTVQVLVRPAPVPLWRQPRARLLLAGLLALTALAWVQGASAQALYRSVGPDGKVSFSDKPPEEAKSGRTAAGVGGGNVSATNSGGSGTLPYELRQVVNKYPVTLYTGAGCGPCGSGKAFLSNRGIPYVEKTVTSNEDIEALQRIAGDNSLPLLTIGSQQLKGYSDAEWGQYLEAAGYPKTSGLPANFRNPPASPLVAIQRPAVNTAAPAGQAGGSDGATTTINRRGSSGGAASGDAAAAPAPASNANNPAGIRF